MERKSLGDRIDCIDDPRNVPKHSKEQADPELHMTAEFEEDSQWREDDCQDDIYAVGCPFLHFLSLSLSLLNCSKTLRGLSLDLQYYILLDLLTAGVEATSERRKPMAVLQPFAPLRLRSAVLIGADLQPRRQRRIIVRASAVSSAPKARFVAKRTESASVRQLQRPLVEYMSLPASQYSVLDAERIERIEDNTFRCYVYRFKFFAFEVCPVLLVRVDEEPFGCCIRLLSCKLEGSPLVEAQNDKFSASMVNKISCSNGLSSSSFQQLTTDTNIEVSIEIPFAFRAIPVEVIESTGTQVLEQLLRIMLPRFLKQLIKDYEAWATGDTSRKPLGTGQI